MCPIVSAAAGRCVVAAIVLLGVASCSAPAPPPQDEEEAQALGRDTDETVFDDMVQTQDRARAVNDVALGHKRDLDGAIEQSSTGDAAGVEDPAE